MKRDFILFKQGVSIRALLVPSRDLRDENVHILGAPYKLANLYLGDFNHLLDSEQRLVGLEFFYWEAALPELRKSPIVRDTQSASIETNGDLRLWLGDARTAKSDLSQAIGGEVFVGERDVVLSIPEVTEWPVSSGIGFDLLDPQSVGFRFAAA